jgi:hypothetical protein
VTLRVRFLTLAPGKFFERRRAQNPFHVAFDLEKLNHLFTLRLDVPADALIGQQRRVFLFERVD